MSWGTNPLPFAHEHFVQLYRNETELIETAMTLGRTYLTTESDPKPLSRHDLDLIVR